MVAVIPNNMLAPLNSAHEVLILGHPTRMFSLLHMYYFTTDWCYKNSSLWLCASPLCCRWCNLDGDYLEFNVLFSCPCLLEYLEAWQVVIERHCGFLQQKQVGTRISLWQQEENLWAAKAQTPTGSTFFVHDMSVTLRSKKTLSPRAQRLMIEICPWHYLQIAFGV